MKLTSGDQTPLLTSKAANASAIGGIGVSGPTLPGQGLLSNSSNTATWQPTVSTVTSNGSNTLLGPFVNLASGSNTTFSVASNTLTISATASGSSLTVQDEGTPLASAASIINFTGSGVTATGSGSTKTVDIPGMVPYYIAPTETFTVPLYRQALYAMTIDNEGTLDVLGFLIEVD